MTPLCPHCFREDCPWLDRWSAWDYDQTTMGLVGPPNADPEPTDDDCPHFGKPIPPLVAKRLRERLAVGYNADALYAAEILACHRQGHRWHEFIPGGPRECVRCRIMEES